jgi:hypothetical protein
VISAQKAGVVRYASFRFKRKCIELLYPRLISEHWGTQMSRRERSDRLCVEDCLGFDIAGLVRDGVFRAAAVNASCWKDESGQETLRITHWLETTATGQLFLSLVYGVPNVFTLGPDETIEIAETRLHFGSRRWFLCPRSPYGIPCRQRVRFLYLLPGGRSLGCRKCHDLTYRSAQEHDKRVDALLKRPPAELAQVLSGGNFTQRLLAIRAGGVLLRRLRKKAAKYGLAAARMK